MNTNSTLTYPRKILPALSVQCHFYCSRINTTEEKMSTEFKGSGSFSQICLVLPLSYIYYLFTYFYHASTIAQGEKKSFPFLHDIYFCFYLLLRLTALIFLFSP